MLRPLSLFRTGVVAVGILLALGGTGHTSERDLTFDASSLEAFRKSVAAIHASLPPERLEKLKSASMAIVFGHALKDTQGSGLERLTQMGVAMKDPEKILELLLASVGGKTADQVIQMAAIQKLGNLEKRRQELVRSIETLEYLIANHDEIHRQGGTSGDNAARVDHEALAAKKRRLAEKQSEKSRLEAVIRETERDALPDQ